MLVRVLTRGSCLSVCHLWIPLRASRCRPSPRPCLPPSATSCPRSAKLAAITASCTWSGRAGPCNTLPAMPGPRLVELACIHVYIQSRGQRCLAQHRCSVDACPGLATALALVSLFPRFPSFYPLPVSNEFFTCKAGLLLLPSVTTCSHGCPSNAAATAAPRVCVGGRGCPAADEPNQVARVQSAAAPGTVGPFILNDDGS